MYKPTFVSEWPRHILYEIATWTNGLAFRNIQFSASGMPVIKIAELKAGITGQTKFTMQTFGENVFVRKGDMLFSWSGNPDTSIDVFKWNGPEGWLNQHIFKVTPSNTVGKEYFFYLLKYLKPLFTEIARNKQTTGLGHVTIADLKRIHVGIPTHNEQRAIAHILGTLDDKIELNRQMNETLESIARALFKSWFIDFDPVRAKMEGRKPYGMDAETAALFPDSFEDSPLGKVPRGWDVLPLDKIAHFLNGLALQKFPPTGDEYLPVIKIAELRRGVNESSGRASVNIEPRYVIENGDILFSWSGSLEVVIWCGGRGALNQHLFKVTSDKYPKWLYYHWIKEYLPEFQAIAAGKATTMGHIQRRHLSTALTIVPPRAELEIISNTFEPLLETIVNNNLQSKTLSTVRDTLLPKLLSGEIRVKDAEKLVENSVNA